MKKMLAVLSLTFFAFSGLAIAQTNTIASESGLAYNSSFVLPLNANGQGSPTVSAQVALSSGTYPVATFTDGTASTGNITVASLTGLTTAYASNSLTVPATSLLTPKPASDYLTVISTTGITGMWITVNGTKLVVGRDWTAGPTIAASATSIATAMNKLSGVVASTSGASGEVVSATSTASGAYTNKYTLASSSPTAISVNSAYFTGGQDSALQNASITFNGTTGYNGREWYDDGTSTGTAVSICSWLQDFSVIKSTVAVGSSSTIYSTATTQGAGGDAYTLSVSTTAITLGGATFSGGAGNASVTVGGKTFTANVDFLPGSSTGDAATNLAAAIHASSMTTHVDAEAVGSVVNATSTVAGSNVALVSSAPTVLVVAGMSNGAVSAINTTNSSITAGTGYPLGLAVKFSTVSASVPPANLLNQTTYYVIPVGVAEGALGTTYQLATSTANAIAGTNIVISTQPATTGYSYTLTPLAITGTASVTWKISNDCVNYTTLATTPLGQTISAISFGSPYTASNTTVDLGLVDAACLQAAVVAPTAGGLKLNITTNTYRM